ncbi:MAG: sigma-70 family RNA polymerase sigma factor, partial [Planctomycetes bacterium]|nr:sigma-70 family RNA polymerase sigma factor [Planctomycetota bacterium]
SGLVRSDASVSDVAQEAALAVVRTEGAVFTESRSFRAYLWRAAWRLLVRRLRRRREYVPLDSALPAPASSDAFSRLDQDETARAVRFALHLLGEDERGLLEMSFFQGRTNKQIAEALGITAEAARMRLARARRKMAGKLGAWRSLVERDEGAES